MATELELEPPITEQSVLNCLTHGRCRSTAFGMPVGYNGLDGWQATGFHAAERCRRSLAGARRLFASG
jgi:hypothetical protein